MPSKNSLVCKMRKEERILVLESNIAILEQQIRVWQDEIDKLEGTYIE